MRVKIACFRAPLPGSSKMTRVYTRAVRLGPLPIIWTSRWRDWRTARL